jgi:hypothetical protein
MTEDEILKKHLSDAGKKGNAPCVKSTRTSSQNLLLREEKIAGKTALNKADKLFTGK